MKSVKIFFILLILFIHPARVNAEESGRPGVPRLNADGIIFQIRDAYIHSPDCQKAPCPDSGPLTLDFEMTNDSGTRKLDYERPFEFALKDEFGNVYRRMPEPEDFPGKIFERGSHFPSIYPGERFRQKLFFEKPVEASRKLFLTVEPGLKDAPAALELLLPPVRRDLPPLSAGRVPAEDDLRIETLLPDGNVRPGQSVFFRIILSGDLLPPEKILLFLPQTVYEDEELLYQYQVNIPEDQPPGGLTIVVVAKWGGILDGATVSKSFTVDVREETRAQ